MREFLLTHTRFPSEFETGKVPSLMIDFTWYKIAIKIYLFISLFYAQIIPSLRKETGRQVFHFEFCKITLCYAFNLVDVD